MRRRTWRTSASRWAQSSSLQTLGTNVLNTGFGVVTGVATARGMDPSSRGVLVALILWTSTVATFSVLGLDEAVLYNSAGDASKSRSLRASLARHLRRQAIVGALILVVINFAIVRGEAWVAVISTCFLALMVPLNAYVQLSFAQLRVEQLFTRWNAIRLLPAATYSCGIAALALASQLTVASGVIALLAGTAVTALVCRLSIHSARATPAPEPSVDQARSYGRKLVIANVPYMANQRLDQLLLGLLAAPFVLGIYAVAVSFAALVQMIGTSLEQVLFPRMTAGYIKSDVIPKLIARVALVLTIAVLPLALFASQLIEFVYGSPYTPAERPLQILLFGTVMVVVGLILTAEAKSQARLADLLHSQLVGMAITAATLFPFVHYWGITGAAVSSTLAYSVVTIMLVLRRRRSGKTLNQQTDITRSG